MSFLISDIDVVIGRALDRLYKFQRRTGEIQFPLEADCTITADYILFNYFIGDFGMSTDNDKAELTSFVDYILNKQIENDGSWPLYDNGAGDLSCTVRCYFALKIAHEFINNPQIDSALLRAKTFILSNGGAEKANVFTLIKLALFRQIPWEVLPWMPTQAILLPSWFPFNYYKVSYWTRVTYATLSLLVYFKPKPKLLRVDVQELFVHNPWSYKDFVANNLNWRGKLFLKAERALAKLNDFLGRPFEERGVKETIAWVKERLNLNDGIGAIYPPMENVCYMEKCTFNHIPIFTPIEITRSNETLHRLKSKLPNVGSFIQPCISPVWDTAISLMALNELGVNDRIDSHRIDKLKRYLLERQISTVGDWAVNTGLPATPKNGWAFQNRNDYYPDVDDTAMVINALEPYQEALPAIRQAKAWLAKMQSKNGGYAAFDVDNTSTWLNWLPFADHGAMIDPPTVDVSGRALSVMAGSEELSSRDQARLVKYILREQETGSTNLNAGLWWGRWGTNYLWGTWSAIMGLKHVKSKKIAKAMQKAGEAISKRALVNFNNCDYHWFESNISYEISQRKVSIGKLKSPFHTALAVLTLIDIVDYHVRNGFRLPERAGYENLIKRGVTTLIATQDENGGWENSYHNAPGFPKVFYLKYHGYPVYFPLWALAAYKKRHDDMSIL